MRGAGLAGPEVANGAWDGAAAAGQYCCGGVAVSGVGLKPLKVM